MEYSEFDGDTFSVLNWKYLFLSKFEPRNQNYQFKLKFGTCTNLNMQNSMVMFTFSVLNKKFGPKIQNCLFKVKVST